MIVIATTRRLLKRGEDNMAERVTVRKAAELTGLSELTIRIGLQKNMVPFGFAIKTSENRYTYHISPKKLEEYIGKPVK